MCRLLSKKVSSFFTLCLRSVCIARHIFAAVPATRALSRESSARDTLCMAASECDAVAIRPTVSCSPVTRLTMSRCFSSWLTNGLRLSRSSTGVEDSDAWRMYRQSILGSCRACRPSKKRRRSASVSSPLRVTSEAKRSIRDTDLSSICVSCARSCRSCLPRSSSKALASAKSAGPSSLPRRAISDGDRYRRWTTLVLRCTTCFLYACTSASVRRSICLATRAREDGCWVKWKGRPSRASTLRFEVSSQKYFPLRFSTESGDDMNALTSTSFRLTASESSPAAPTAKGAILR